MLKSNLRKLIFKNSTFNSLSIVFRIKNRGFSYKKEEISEELRLNPKFDEIFPELERNKLKPRTTLNKQEKELDFLKSLGLDRRIQKNYEDEDIFTENYNRYEEGFNSPTGPLKYMSEEEKQKINLQIDEKLEDLEATGLSKEEILYEDGKRGIPLDQDPFFQFIKKNYLVRELLLKPGEEYTVKKVVELALSQDIGIDPSQSTSIPKIQDQEYMTQDLNENSTPVSTDFRPSVYLTDKSQSTKEYIDELLKPDEKYHFKPQTAAQKRKKLKRNLNYFDIHWRNTELLSKFLLPSSFEKSRKQTRLSADQHKRLSKQIKIAKHMQLLPVVGSIKPAQRESLTTLEEELENYTTSAINLETGHIYTRDPANKSSIFNQDYELVHSSLQKKDNENLIQSLKYSKKQKEKQLIREGISVEELKNPTNLMENLKQKEDTPNKLKLSGHHTPLLDFENDVDITETYLKDVTNDDEKIESSFNKLKQQVIESGVQNVISNFLAEKAFNYEQLEKNCISNQASSKTKRSVEENLEILNKVRRTQGLSDLSTRKLNLNQNE